MKWLLVNLQELKDKSGWIQEAQYYRLAYRAVASSTNERTVISTLLPPGAIAGNSAPIERNPKQRPNSYALCLIAIINSFAFDWATRLRVSSNINQFILNTSPVPSIGSAATFLVHNSLRLISNHEGYLPLWKEQLGAIWYENKPQYSFPVLESEEKRWDIRAAIDAIVAQAYGLNREQYEHILHSFDRATSKNLYTDTCLEKWDELHSIGLQAFIHKYDPYSSIPLLEALPKPVVDMRSIITPPSESTALSSEAVVDDDILSSEKDDIPRDLFGNPVPTDLFGNLLYPDNAKKKKR